MDVHSHFLEIVIIDFFFLVMEARNPASGYGQGHTLAEVSRGELVLAFLSASGGDGPCLGFLGS